MGGAASEQKNAPELPIGRFLKSKSLGGNRVTLSVVLREGTLFAFTPDVADWLLRHDWHADRSVDVPEWVPAMHPAHSILKSFGGLSLLSYSDEFPDDPIAEIDFGILSPDDTTAANWSRLLGSTLIGIGVGHNQHENVYSDAEGKIYGRSLMHDAFYLLGPSLLACLHNLLTRTRAKPMLRPDQNSIRLYGRTFDSTSDELHRY